MFRPPNLPRLWVLALGLGWAAGCGQQRGPADGVGLAQDAPPGMPRRVAPLQQTHGNAADPGQILEAALRTVEDCNSLSAEIVYEVNLYGRQLVGQGMYLQKRSGDDLLSRLELKTQLGDQTGSLVQVCDGEYLWTKRRIGDSQKLSRIDMLRVKQALQASGGDPGTEEIRILPGLGGLPKLLRGFRKSFDFIAVEQTRRGRLERPVCKLWGQWKTEMLERVLPKKKAAALRAGEAVDFGALPQHLFDHVVLFFLARESPFPYRVEYHRTVPARLLRPQSPTSRPVVTMELRNIDVNKPIDANRFLFNPGGLKAEDETARCLASLHGPTADGTE